MTEVVNIEDGFGKIDEPWVPTIAGELNGQYVKFGIARGSYVWHHHAAEDEMFLVTKGTLDIWVREADGEEVCRTLTPGEFTIIPRGMEHKPVARDGDAHFVLFEPKETRNTGNVDHQYTIEPDDLTSLA